MLAHHRTSHDFWLGVARTFPKLALACTIPYGIAVKSRVLLYEWGWLSQGHLPCPVVSIGNLTVGGTGKTPLVIWLARWIRSKGVRTGVLSRGYGRTNEDGNLLVSNGEKVFVGPKEAGDESFLIANQCPGVAVAVGSNRYRLGRWVLDQMPIECFVLDDGFQHLGLYRDLNLLLIDAMDESGLHSLLPAGRLREPLKAAERASAVVLTRTNSTVHSQQVLDPVEKAMGKKIAPILVDFRISSFIHVASGCTMPLETVNGKPILIFSGIGNAQGFRALISRLGVKIVEEMVFPDHFVYSETDCMTIRQRAQNSGAQLVITTEKDAVKVASYVTSVEEIWAVQLELQVGEGKDRLENLVVNVLSNNEVERST